MIATKNNGYGIALARTIGRIFYNNKEPSKVENDLMKNGWVEEEKMFERIGKIREEGNSTGRKYPVC